MCFILTNLLIILFMTPNIKSFPHPRPEMYLNKAAADTEPVGGYRGQLSRLKINTDIILVQREGKSETTYHLADDPNGHPIFTRSRKDHGKKFIVFHHPSFPAGSGHYIVLKKMEQQIRSEHTRKFILYECFVLNFKDTLHGTVSDLDPMYYKQYQYRVAG